MTFRLMPPGVEDIEWPLLTCGMDRGSVGSGGSFAVEGIVLPDDKCFMYMGYFDKYHKVICNLLAATRRAADGVFQQTRLWSTHIWALNYKLYTSGCWEHDKRALLAYFWISTTYRSAVFRKYAPRIAAAANVPLNTDADYQHLYENVLPLLPSFQGKGPLSKLLRWFAWQEQCDFHVGEGPALEMTLENYYGECVPIDESSGRPCRTPEQELRALKSETGGFKLAQKFLSSTMLEERMRGYYIVCQSTWSWYTREIREVKNPQDGISELLRFATLPSPALFEELSYMVQHSFNSQPNLDWIGWRLDSPLALSQHQQDRMEEYDSLVLHVAGERSWAKLMVRTPPWCYVGLTSADRVIVDAAAQLMRDDATRIYDLDAARFTDHDAMALHGAIARIVKHAVRILILIFEVHGFNAVTCLIGQKLLRGLLMVLPDTRVVEELHAYLRDLARHSRLVWQTVWSPRAKMIPL